MRPVIPRLVMLAMVLVSGCSLLPVLSDNALIRPTHITVTATRTSQRSLAWQLRRELESGLYLPYLNGQARLDITLSDSLDRLALEQDGSITRTIYFSRADYVLRAADGTELVRNSAHAQTGYDPAEYGFADILSQVDQHTEAAIRLARDIRTGLTAALALRNRQ